MGTALNRLSMGAFGILAVVSAMLFATAGNARAADTVTITGNAYAFIFGGNVDRLEGAEIKIAELPDVSTTAGPNGAYSLEVPDDTTITPYASFPGYQTIYLQTFHTRGKDLNQINFQIPKTSIYNLLADVVGAERDPVTNNPVKCAIVSTFFQKEGRSFLDFNDFHNFRPHGIIGATASGVTATGQSMGDAIYFNSSVIPDRTQLSSSRDGGVVWTDIEDGVYTVSAEHPTAKFSQFEATCKSGRLINANPPWGLYEMARTEEPNPAALPYVAPPEPKPDPDTVLDANLYSAKVIRKGAKKRTLTIKIRSGENVAAVVSARQGKRKLRASKKLASGTSTITIPVGAAYKPGSLSLSVKLTDEAANSRIDQADLNVPAIKKAKKKR